MYLDLNLSTVNLFAGQQALPIAAPKQPALSPIHQLPEDCLRGVGHSDTRGPGGFRQGTEPSRKFLVDLNTGLVKEHVSEMDRRVGEEEVNAKLMLHHMYNFIYSFLQHSKYGLRLILSFK